MRSHDIRVDVAGLVDLEGKLETAATVHLPDKVDGPLTLLVGYPGGGYSRGYYDIRRLPGYSQAEHHVDRGFAFVACDHLGIGDSSLVDSFDLTFERLAAANHATASAVTEGLRTGSLIHGVAPMEIGKVVAMGQSMGGCLLTVQQALHRTFDGIAVLGYSCVKPSLPPRTAAGSPFRPRLAARTCVPWGKRWASWPSMRNSFAFAFMRPTRNPSWSEPTCPHRRAANSLHGGPAGHPRAQRL